MRRDQKINKNRATFVVEFKYVSYQPYINQHRAREFTDLVFLRCELNSVLVPGHGISIVLENDKPPQLCDLEVVIRAWYGEGLKQTTVISPGPQGRSAKIAA
ncbi:MAG: hypothetical protein CFH10_01637 [Alphaproteobacteria bacterium MarineAlpha4_Bin2]|nr:MAG: hypothetical protein CFH10_01637 [Alphaproteobacteria bacterium MarineAlpha4_Bin2]